MSSHTGFIILKAKKSYEDGDDYSLFGGTIFDTEKEAWDAIPEELDGHYRIFRVNLAGSRLKLWSGSDG